jgi:hypothetical protein
MNGMAETDWDERDAAARGELTRRVHPFGFSVHRERVNPAGMVEAYRGADQIGWVTVYPTTVDWLIDTQRIHLNESYRFKKDLHAAGEYQPRWGLFLMEHVFAVFPGCEIRESLGDNDPPGIPFVARVRREYGLPYHLPQCFQPADQGQCLCRQGNDG